MIVTIININVNFIVELLSDKHIGLRYRISITIMDIDKTILRDIHLAFIKMHILYHAAKEEVFGIGLIRELKRHGYKLSPGTLYPTLAKMQQSGLLTCECRTVQHKQQKYYRITRAGEELLDEVKKNLEELYDEIVKENGK
jgi:DNA-binding PadR family transcriptional regulator